METSRFHNKMTLHVFGKEKRIMKTAQEKGALIIDNGMIKGKSRNFIFFFFMKIHQISDYNLLLMIYLYR